MRQYAFYIKPDGNIYEGKDSKYAPEAILSEIGMESRINSNGQIEVKKFRPLILLDTLSAAIKIIDKYKKKLNDKDTAEIVNHGIVSIVKNKQGASITSDKFISTINNLASGHFRKSKKKYILISLLSISEFPASRIKIGGCLISSLKKRGLKYPPPNDLHLKRNTTKKLSEGVGNKYVVVKVVTEGRSEYEAVEQAIDALNILRGLWSLWSSFGKIVRRGGYHNPVPIGNIHIGKYHTLHNEDGTLVKKSLYWYEDNVVDDHLLYRPSEGWKSIENFRRLATKKIENLAYNNEMQNLIIRYINALDQVNMDMAFLNMWSILEYITDTIGKRYDETIKRAVWPIRGKEKAVAKNMLEILRINRNKCVHSGEARSGGKQSAELIKSILDPHLLALIFNIYKIQNLKEYAEILNLSNNINDN